MSQASIRIPAPLRPLTDGAGEVAAQGATVGEVLKDLDRRHAGLWERLVAEDGQLRTLVNVYLEETNVRSLDGLASPVEDGAILHIVPAVAGG